MSKYYQHGRLKALLKILIIILIIVICICVYNIALIKVKKKETSKLYGETLKIDSITEEIEVPDDIIINMSVIGDIMCHNTQYNDAYVNGQYDFSYVFSDIQDKLLSADIAVGNLETTFAGSERGYSSYPTFNTPEVLAYDLKEAGIDLVSTANNHSLDKGYSGIESTIKYLDEAGLSHTGTFTNEESKNNITIMDVKGVKIAFLSFTYGTNGIPVPSGKEYCINLIDKDLIVNQLTLAKEQKPDIICVFMHWGEEYEKIPNSEQNELADLLFQNGANIILGSHPHVLQKMEKRTVTMPDGTNRDGFIIYSLGNFVSGQVKENTRDSIILNLNITKRGTGDITIDNATYTPIYTYKKSSGTVNRYEVLDIKKALDNFDNGNYVISSDEYNMLKSEYNKIVTTVGSEF